MLFTVRPTFIYFLSLFGSCRTLPMSTANVRGLNFGFDFEQTTRRSGPTTTIDYDLADFDEFVNDPGIYDIAGSPDAINLADDNDQGFANQPGFDTGQSLFDSLHTATPVVSNPVAKIGGISDEIQENVVSQQEGGPSDEGVYPIAGNGQVAVSNKPGNSIMFKTYRTYNSMNNNNQTQNGEGHPDGNENRNKSSHSKTSSTNNVAIPPDSNESDKSDNVNSGKQTVQESGIREKDNMASVPRISSSSKDDRTKKLSKETVSMSSDGNTESADASNDKMVKLAEALGSSRDISVGSPESDFVSMSGEKFNGYSVYNSNSRSNENGEAGGTSSKEILSGEDVSGSGPDWNSSQNEFNINTGVADSFGSAERTDSRLSSNEEYTMSSEYTASKNYAEETGSQFSFDKGSQSDENGLYSSDKTGPQPNENGLYSSDETGSQSDENGLYSSGENGSQSEENGSNFLDENSSQTASNENTPQSSSDENWSRASSDENLSQSTSDENVTELVSDENSSYLSSAKIMFSPSTGKSSKDPDNDFDNDNDNVVADSLQTSNERGSAANDGEDENADSKYQSSADQKQDLADCFSSTEEDGKFCPLLRSLYSICSVQFKEECISRTGNSQQSIDKAYPKSNAIKDSLIDTSASDDSTEDLYPNSFESISSDEPSSTSSNPSSMSAETIENLSASFERSSGILDVIDIIRDACSSICALADSSNGPQVGNAKTESVKDEDSSESSDEDDFGAKEAYTDSDEDPNDDNLNFSYVSSEENPISEPATFEDDKSVSEASSGDYSFEKNTKEQPFDGSFSSSGGADSTNSADFSGELNFKYTSYASEDTSE